MWQIKNEELRKTVGALFTDEEIDEKVRHFWKTNSTYVRLQKYVQPSYQTVIFEIPLEEFKLIYNPNGWNPYPSVTPPSEGDWFVQHKDGEFSVKEFHASYGPEGCEKWWEGPTAVCYTVVAFRALPEKYVE